MEDIDRADEPQSIADPVTDLREHCKAFITAAMLLSPYRGHALAKMDEMIFWIRSGTSR